MRQNFFEYLPQFKLMIIGNHKPKLRSLDEAMRRRFNIVPFLHKPAKKDTKLEAKLRKEGPAILRWMIEGCLAWQTSGLIRPKVVADATDEYFAENDLVREWIGECCDTGGRDLRDSLKNLYASWTAWAKAHGEWPRTVKDLAAALAQAGLESGKNKHGKYFLGIRVKPDALAPEYVRD